MVNGKVYEFDKDRHYMLAEATKQSQTTADNAYGSLCLMGEIVDISSTDGVAAYKVDNDNLAFTYTYTNKKLAAPADQWHIIDDKSKKVDTLTLDENILKGTIIVQTSKDLKTWVTVNAIQNVFADEKTTSADLYVTKDIQQDNGCYYRVLVVYKLERQTEQKNVLFVDTSKYETKKVAEEYIFYIYNSTTGADAADPNQTYKLGDAVKADQFDGYWGEKPIKKGDPHYGVNLGQFFVSGYTDNVTDTDGNIVFLKNVGDKVTLWFRLNENIDGFSKNSKVSVTADANGSDQYFQIDPTNFGRGTLIIKYTDYHNTSPEPQVYTNYLEANATVGADTTVRLCEEGDYEVALDYELTEDKLIDSIGHYRIFFNFSIRNGNCMVYPIDLATGGELTNSSMTENGFRLDLARSRYLKVNVKREQLAKGADGLTEDIRFNGPAKDGAEYKDEGIYTITVTNQYTKQSTEKRIYVGTNPVLRAYMTTGISISEINSLVAKGATINPDGTIVQAISDDNFEPAGKGEEVDTPEKSHHSSIFVLIIAIVAVITAVAIFILRKKTTAQDTVLPETPVSLDEDTKNREGCDER